MTLLQGNNWEKLAAAVPDMQPNDDQGFNKLVAKICGKDDKIEVGSVVNQVMNPVLHAPEYRD